MFEKLKRYLIKKWTGLTYEDGTCSEIRDRDCYIADLKKKLESSYHGIPKMNNVILSRHEKIPKSDLFREDDFGREYCSSIAVRERVKDNLLEDASRYIQFYTEEDPIDLTYSVYGMIEVVDHR